jgi:hypothetical protein
MCSTRLASVIFTHFQWNNFSQMGEVAFRFIKTNVMHPDYVYCCVSIHSNISILFIRMDVNRFFWVTEIFWSEQFLWSKIFNQIISGN